MGSVAPLTAFGPPYERLYSKTYWFYYNFLPRSNFQVFEEDGTYSFDLDKEGWTGPESTSEELARFKSVIADVASRYNARVVINVYVASLYRRYHEFDGQPLDDPYTIWVLLSFDMSNVRNPERMSRAICTKLAKAMRRVESDHLNELARAHMM